MDSVGSGGDFRYVVKQREKEIQLLAHGYYYGDFHNRGNVCGVKIGVYAKSAPRGLGSLEEPKCCVWEGEKRRWLRRGWREIGAAYFFLEELRLAEAVERRLVALRFLGV